MLENGDSMDSMAMESMGSRTIKPKTELPTKPRVLVASATCGALQFILSRTLFVFVGLVYDFVKVCQPQVLTFFVCVILSTMSKARKLQQEMDATLKKVHEGVEQWSEEWRKLEATEVSRVNRVDGVSRKRRQSQYRH
jgi:hypothetical protein